MPRPNLLTKEEIKIKMEDFPLWELKDNTIIKEIVAINFVSAVGVINSISIFAEILDHHPNILLYSWNKLRITLTTDDMGGLTKLDFELAKKIESLKL